MSPRPRGRPTLYNAEVARAICDWLAAGKSLLSFTEQPGTPKYATIYLWREKDPDFAGQFARARELGNHILEERRQHLADLEPKNMVQVAWRKLQIDTIDKTLANRDPKRYGTKVGVEHAGGVSVKVELGPPLPNEERMATYLERFAKLGGAAPPSANGNGSANGHS